MNVNEIIRATKIDPTAVIRAINRLVKGGLLIEYRYQNRRLIAFPMRLTRYYFDRLKKEDETIRRSQAQKEIIALKMQGKLPSDVKKSKILLQKDSLEYKLMKINDYIQKALDDKDKGRWLELYEKRDKLYIELYKLYGLTGKPTTMKRKLELFEKGFFFATVGIGPIASKPSLEPIDSSIANNY